jgi:PII-like signaling protein
MGCIAGVFDSEIATKPLMSVSSELPFVVRLIKTAPNLEI